MTTKSSAIDEMAKRAAEEVMVANAVASTLAKAGVGRKCGVFEEIIARHYRELAEQPGATLEAAEYDPEDQLYPLATVRELVLAARKASERNPLYAKEIERLRTALEGFRDVE